MSFFLKRWLGIVEPALLESKKSDNSEEKLDNFK